VKKVTFFPYHPDIEIIADNVDSLIDYEICGFMSFKEDIDLVRTQNHSLGLETLPDEHLLRNCDAVILLDNYRNWRTEKYYKIIEIAELLQREVLVTPLAYEQLDLGNYEGLYQIMEHIPVNIDSINEEYNSRLGSPNNMLHTIDIPVIGVVGQGKSCGKFENQLHLKSVLESEYTISTVSSNSLGTLFGCYSLPHFLFENRPFVEKILKFNYFMKTISKNGELDAVVLGIPEGITPFLRHEFHHFAEYPLVIANAVEFDLAILCTYFISGGKLEEGLKMLIEHCYNKFNIPVSTIAMSRVLVDIPNEENENITFEYLTESYLRKHSPSFMNASLQIFNTFDRAGAKEAISTCLSQLKENVAAI